MANRTVYVSQNGNSGTLKLRDSEGHDPGNDDLTTDVDTGDTITWVLDPDATHPIYSIEAVNYSAPQDGPPPKYQNSVPLLYQTVNGTKITNGYASLVDGVWTGYVVDTSPGQNKKEYYQIGFKRTENDTVQYDDPVLKMRN